MHGRRSRPSLVGQGAGVTAALARLSPAPSASGPNGVCRLSVLRSDEALPGLLQCCLHVYTELL
jgi:hypothetical protein